MKTRILIIGGSDWTADNILVQELRKINGDGEKMTQLICNTENHDIDKCPCACHECTTGQC